MSAMVIRLADYDPLPPKQASGLPCQIVILPSVRIERLISLDEPFFDWAAFAAQGGPRDGLG